MNLLALSIYACLSYFIFYFFTFYFIFVFGTCKYRHILYSHKNNNNNVCIL